MTAKPLRRLAVSPQDSDNGREPSPLTTLAAGAWGRFERWAQNSPTRAYIATVAMAGAAGALIALPAAPVAAAYGAYGLTALLRARRGQHVKRLRDNVNHELELLVGDIRSGAASVSALARLAARCHGRGREHADAFTTALADRLMALAAVVEHTGAPAVALLERLVSDLHARSRAEAALAANTAGTRVSVRMLAALPLLGPLLGAAIGADPVTVLFHTPIGIMCLIVALTLQTVGLAWSSRIRRAVEGQVLMH